MSDRELMKADWALRDAHREVTLARLALDDLHRGVSTASTALTEAELFARSTNPEAWMQSVAPEDLNRVGRLCDSAASVGVEIASHLKMASESIENARQTLERVDRAGLQGPAAANLAALEARTAAVGEVVDLALPMATASSEHLYSAAHGVGAGRSPGSDAASIQPIPAVTFGSLSMVSNGLGRAEADERHLGRTVERAEASIAQVATEAECITADAQARLGQGQSQHQASSQAAISFEGPAR
ncbi:hypothetical protein ACQP1U_09935 [Actinomycetota bacterium]